jgi:hypothetical protein
MFVKRSKLFYLFLGLSILTIGTDGRKGSFENKLSSGTAIPLLPGVALLSQRISIDDELIRSVILLLFSFTTR